MDRRKFLKRMGLGGAAAGATIIAGRALARVPQEDPPVPAAEPKPFKRRVTRGWKLTVNTWCGHCGYVQLPGPFTVCCPRPLLNVAVKPEVNILAGAAGAEMFTDAVISVDNWGEANEWDHTSEWRSRAHKIGLKIPEPPKSRYGWLR